ncbi:MAG TPA: V-type ATP synthase subunit F [Thermoanaerobaculia bacterium]|nr:V-type ATP synthase subunit F [Thermoanaerobaculia bacterium]
MRIRLVGDADDALGFSLAGIEGIVPRDRREADRAFAAIEAEKGIGLVLVSAAVEDLGSPALERLKLRGGIPAIVVLPARARGDASP